MKEGGFLTMMIKYDTITTEGLEKESFKVEVN